MKTIQTLGILALAFQLGIQTQATAADDSREADHAALRQLRDKVVAGVNNQDTKALANCFTRDFAFTTVTQSVLTNEAQVQAYFDRMFGAKDGLLVSMKTEPKADILTRFIDANTGVCYGSARDTYTLKGGQVVTMNLRWSATVVKQDGQWKVALAHAGTDFIENPVVEKLSSFWRIVSLAAGIGGAVLGVILCAVITRARKRGAA